MAKGRKSAAMHESSRLSGMSKVWRALALVVGVLLNGFLPMPAALAGGEAAIGEWRTPARMYVQIYLCDESLCGRIVRLPDPRVRDASNPEPHLRMRPLLGIQVLSGLEHAANGNGWKGQLYVPERGATYDAELRVVDDSKLEITTCGPMGLFCTRETWSRTR